MDRKIHNLCCTHDLFSVILHNTWGGGGGGYIYSTVQKYRVYIHAHIYVYIYIYIYIYICACVFICFISTTICPPPHPPPPPFTPTKKERKRVQVYQKATINLIMNNLLVSVVFVFLAKHSRICSTVLALVFIISKHIHMYNSSSVRLAPPWEPQTSFLQLPSCVPGWNPNHLFSDWLPGSLGGISQSRGLWRPIKWM